MKTWTQRDLPVLQFLNEHPPEHGVLWTNSLSEQPHDQLPSVTEQEFHYAVETLADASFVSYDKREGEGGAGTAWMGFQVTGAGKQLLGDWPMFEVLGQPAGLGATLTALAGLAGSDEEEESLRQAADAAGDLGESALQQLAVGALAELARSVTS